MSDPSPHTDEGARALAAILSGPADTLIAVDFDGTLASIVDDPEHAYANEHAVSALGRLGPRVAGIAVITGRPARTAVRLGRFDQVPGLASMVVIGQYGVERWNAATGEFIVPPEPPEVVAVAEELPAILEALDLADARVEHKGRALGVHTRTLPEPAAAFERLDAPMRELADRHGLAVEPGKNVWEIRAATIDKGEALRDFVAECGARHVIFAGDDLGDLPAFHAVAAMRSEGYEGLLICSASHEEDALTELSDLVLAGPEGVAEWLNWLADSLHQVDAPN